MNMLFRVPHARLVLMAISCSKEHNASSGVAVIGPWRPARTGNLRSRCVTPHIDLKFPAQGLHGPSPSTLEDVLCSLLHEIAIGTSRACTMLAIKHIRQSSNLCPRCSESKTSTPSSTSGPPLLLQADLRRDILRSLRSDASRLRWTRYAQATGVLSVDSRVAPG